MKVVKNFAGVLLLLLALGAVVFAAKLNTIFQFGRSYGIETNEEVIDFQLKNINGGNFKLTDVKGNLVYLYFGYTNCPNLCPIRMSNLLELSKKITRKDVRFIYITIDPTRDTEAKLSTFSKELGKNFLVLYGDSETIKDITKKYKVFYENIGENQFDHSDKLYLLDKDLQIRLIYLTSHKDILRMEEDLTQF